MGFSKSYTECREKFREAAQDITAVCTSEYIPSKYLPGYIEDNLKSYDNRVSLLSIIDAIQRVN